VDDDDAREEATEGTRRAREYPRRALDASPRATRTRDAGWSAGAAERAGAWARAAMRVRPRGAGGGCARDDDFRAFFRSKGRGFVLFSFFAVVAGIDQQKRSARNV
jgi:hypothetical protein